MTTPAEMVAALPLQVGFTPTESLVVLCCHEPRGRVGLSMRFDLPVAALEPVLADEVVRRVRLEDATRVVIAVYTDEEDGPVRAREGLVRDLALQLEDLVVTESVLVRGDRFWSFLCSTESCCPAAGTLVETGRDAYSVQLLAAENVLAGRVVLADRTALARSLAAPPYLLAEVARQRCEAASELLADFVDAVGPVAVRELGLDTWREALVRHRTPPALLGDHESATLTGCLFDVTVRDEVATWTLQDEQPLMLLLQELCRRTPPPYDAPICTLLAWTAYAAGGGAVVRIALERALTSDPSYSMAQLLWASLDAQVPPKDIRQMLETDSAAPPARREAI